MHEMQATSPAPEKVAIVLAAGLPPGQAANIASCIAAGLSIGSPGWAGHALADAAGLQTAASSHLPITVLSANGDAMGALVRQWAAGATVAGGTVSLFPAYAQAMHDCGEYWQRHGGLRHAEEAMLGIGLVGAKRWVNRMTGSLPLWR